MKIFFLLCISFLYLLADAHILIYHRFDDTRYPTTSVSSTELRAQFQYLKDNNYTVVKLHDVVEKIKNNETIPKKWIALTIDDGYKSFYKNAFEIFKEFNYPFTIFVYVEATNKKYSDFMTWEELKEISPLGEIEYHSYSHPHMTNLSHVNLKADFEKGLEIFEKNLGFKPKYFSYPYGEMDEFTQKIAKDYGFEAIFNQNNGAINKKSDIYNLDRLAIVGNVNLKNLLSYEFLHVEWFEPKIYPKDNNSIKIHAKVDTNKNNAKLFISTLGWQDIKIHDGEINQEINATLKNNRTRVILKVGNQYSTKIIVKDKNGTK